MLLQGNDNNCEKTLDLYDPSTKTKTVGSITFGYSAEVSIFYILFAAYIIESTESDCGSFWILSI